MVKPPATFPRSKESISIIDDHPCTLERKYRSDDYLSQLAGEDLKRYQRLADGGDSASMYLLAQIPRMSAAGQREYPYRAAWLPAAAEAGHPVARFELAREARARRAMTDTEYLSRIEEAAAWEAGGDIAWRLAYSYKYPGMPRGDAIAPVQRDFDFLPANPGKALEWARVAAAKGNVMAAEDLCTDMALETSSAKGYGLAQANPQEAVRWCTFAAQAICSQRGADVLAQMYERGIGVRASRIDALIWRRVANERFQRNYARLGEWQYIGVPGR